MTEFAGVAPEPATMDQVADKLTELGPGSSAIVGFDRADGSGHWFNAVNDGGTIKAVDGQSGTVGAWPPSSDAFGFDESEMANSDAIYFDSDSNPVKSTAGETDSAGSTDGLDTGAQAGELVTASRGAVKDSGEPPRPSDPQEMRHTYWTEVPRFQNEWAEHEQKWPKDKQAAGQVDRSGDPPGSWRSDSNLYLSPEDNARADEAIRGVRAAEPQVTTDLGNIVRESPYSAELRGLDFRCKGDDRLKEKSAETMQRRPDATPEDAVKGTNDAIRYTVQLSNENYADGYQDVCDRMRANGYEMNYAQNYWGDDGYKGINTRWETPDGQRFEVQFHTPESYHAKQEVTHQAYERARNPLTTRAEQAELESFQQEVSSWVPVPDGATSIPDYRRGGG